MFERHSSFSNNTKHVAKDFPISQLIFIVPPICKVLRDSQTFKNMSIKKLNYAKDTLEHFKNTSNLPEVLVHISH